MIEMLDTGIVYENPKAYLRSRHAFHPTIVDLGKGELLCAYDLGEAVEALDYRTYRSRSTDGGSSWRFEGPLVTEKTERPSTSSVRISRVSSGLVGFGGRYWRDNPEEGLLNRANLGYVPMELILVRSTDNGKTWSAPETVAPPLVGPAFETCHNIVELPNGRCLAPTSTWRGWDGELPNGEKGFVLISDDQGKTWPSYGVTFDGDAEGLIHWEQSVVFLGGDDVLSIAWVYNPATGKNLANRFSVSHDAGKTFGPPGEIGIDGQTCKMLRLRDERILLAYRRNDRPGLWAVLTRFDGSRFEKLAELPLWGAGLRDSGMRGAGKGSDELSALKFGFPQMVELEDGKVFLVFWCFEDWCTKIRWFRLRIGL